MSRRAKLRCAVPTALVAVVAAFAPAANAQLAVDYSLPKALAAWAANPNGSPPGANDWSCRPSSLHPYPVILVHGTFENQRFNWNALAPLLKNAGYCVFSFNYGATQGTQLTGGFANGLAEVRDSARQLAAFVDRVRAATGAAEVDIVGHSQGGMMPRYYTNKLGGASKVRALVGLSPSNHGTTLSGLTEFARLLGPIGSAAVQLVTSFCPACGDQIRGSAFMQELNAGGDTVAGVAYTVIQTKYDEVVTPYDSAFLTPAASSHQVRNILVQNGCPLDLSEHLAIPFDRRALAYVLNALDPAHPRPVPCVPVAPLIGG